jgi:hypothetical protein
LEDDCMKSSGTVVQERLHYAFDGTESDIVWENSYLDCPDLKTRLRRLCRLGVRLDSQVMKTVNRNIFLS